MLDVPFDVRELNFTLKPEDRPMPALGQAVPVQVDDTSPFKALMDGSGLSDNDADRLLEHSTDASGMWLCETGKAGGDIVIALEDGAQTLGSIAVWNFNKPGYTDLGVRKMDVSVWNANDGWRTIVKDATLEEAEGTDDYDTPTIVTFDPVSAEKIRFENMTAFNADTAQLGLSEVSLHEPLGAAACNPVPADDSQISYSDNITLMWTAGSGAVAHDVYIGEDEDALKLLGRVKGKPRITTAGLAPGKEYVWRIDEISEDESIEQGAVWSLRVRRQQIAHWKLDGTPVDEQGEFDGAVQGAPSWQAGRIGQAVQLDGEDDYIETPALGLNTDTLTICAWINARQQEGIQQQDARTCGIVFCRTDQTVAGINLEGDNLRYHWNDMVQTYSWNPGLMVPRERWVFVALTVQPKKGTLYLYDGDVLKSAANNTIHPPEEFDGALWIGADTGFTNRFFNGLIDEVRVFDSVLNSSQIEKIARDGEIDLSAPAVPRLVDADIVEEGQSMQEVATEAEREETADEGNDNNLIAVGAIILIIFGLLAVLTLGKRK
ncbi:MAG: LamG domain-containing protein [Verrucomicrobia bacterium]|nr:LamG domain-containing protein [Verrucomicrobiota bacterium]MCF7707527.1 LamG domain-containing protein [Verrucomicrobiota bacterium]